jgi:hypothetical protein
LFFPLPVIFKNLQFFVRRDQWMYQ